MNPLSKLARDMYAANEPEGAFADAILRGVFYGVIIVKSTLFLILEPTFTDGVLILQPPARSNFNCWWVHFLAHPPGQFTMWDLLTQTPYSLEYVAFRRRNKTKIYSWEQLARRDIYGRRTQSLSTTST